MIGEHYCRNCGHLEGCVGHNPLIPGRDDRNKVEPKCTNCPDCKSPIIADILAIDATWERAASNE